MIKSKRFGHLAGGIDRQGRNFFTVYYGVEAVFGEGGPRKESPSGESAIAPSRYAAPSRQRRMSRVEQTDDRAAHLFWAVKDLDMRVALEHSFKFLEKTLLSDRLLVGVQQPGDANRRDAILEVCRELAMPEDFQQKFRVQLPNANTILFGFEKSDTRSVYKTYLEFSDRLTEALQKDPKPESVVLHEGFKWDASDNTKKMMAEYRTFLFSEAREMALRISESFYAKSETNAFRIVDDVIDLAGSRTATGELLYFEVTEESNPRRSFDVNLYRANLRMEEVYPLLVAAARHYSVELDRFDALYEDVRTQIFGHLSGGTDRQGRDFLTVYFSEKGSSRAPHGLP
ncbi:MAG: hypothetical protein L7F78_03235 [Syntrophales bacterium LBB04]|nr:hypothetical protein [Syntrophales bacterium LBB04]